MTKQERRKGSLITRGYFLSECRAWSGFDFKDAPWWPKLRAARTRIVKDWAKRQKADLSTVEPADLRRSLTYQQAVRQWYDSHGWVKKRMRYGRTTYRIDPYAAMRWFADNYHKAPEGRGKKSPWKGRQVSRQKRDAAVDKQFSTAPGVVAL